MHDRVSLHMNHGVLQAGGRRSPLVRADNPNYPLYVGGWCLSGPNVHVFQDLKYSYPSLFHSSTDDGASFLDFFEGLPRACALRSQKVRGTRTHNVASLLRLAFL